MELEEMKTLWEGVSAMVEKQKKLTASLIIKMTEARYRNKINKILIPEAAATVVAFAALLFLLIDFRQLNTPYLFGCGIITAVILFLLPLLSLKTIFKMHSLNIPGNNYKQSLLEYSKAKIQFVFVQKLSFYLGAILMLVILPVMGQLIGGKDLFKETNLWLWYATGFIFFYLLARKVLKCYTRSATDAENILKELND